MASGTLDGSPQTWTSSTNDLTTAVKVTGYFSDKSDFMKGDDFVNIITDEDGVPELVRGKLVDTGTVEVPILTLNVANITPADLGLAEGSVLVGNAAGEAAAVDMKTAGEFLQGNGTTAVAVAVDEDASIEVSFATATPKTYKLHFPYKCTITSIKGFVTGVLGATDTGTITARNSAAAAMAGGVMTFAISAAFGVEQTATPTTNNTVTAGSFIELVAAKTTLGGLVHVQVTAKRT